MALDFDVLSQAAVIYSFKVFNEKLINFCDWP